MACFRQKLSAPCVCALPQQIQHIWCPFLHLRNGRPRDGEADAKSPLMFVNQIEQQAGRRPIALVGHLVQNRLIRIRVEIEGIAAEYGIPPQSIWLMDLKIEADGGHQKRSVAAC